MPAPDGGSGDWPVVLGIVAVALLALGWVFLRRRAARAEPVVEPAPIPAAARARLAMTFRPIRAGLNLLSAISENEVVIANTGDAPAENIRVLTQLASAHTGQDDDLAGIYAAPIGRPSVPAFALAPGEERAIISIAALPRDAIRTLTAAGRPMFVPLVAVNILYTTGGIEGQLAQAFAVGVERVDSAKLAPFWLDVPPRTVDQVAARPHAAAVER